MHRTATFIFTIIFLCFGYEVSFGQTQTENNSQQLAIKNTISRYYKSLGEQSGIYRGTEYTGYPFRVRSGHQYFESADISYGSVFYDGILYEGVPMRYDIVKNEVVVLYPDNVSGIRLHNQKIKYLKKKLQKYKQKLMKKLNLQKKLENLKKEVLKEILKVVLKELII